MVQITCRVCAVGMCLLAGYELWAARLNAAGGIKVADALGTNSYTVQVSLLSQ